MRNTILTFSFSLFVLIGCTQTHSGTEPDRASDREQQTDEPIVNKKSLQEILRENNIPKSELSVKIDKSEYTLEVLHKNEVLITYPCVFGFNAVDDKHQEGDGCTPEGTFGIRSKYAHKSWKYFIWIDYPNKESWSKFNKRKADGTLESNATIGGEIGIHGVPEGADQMIANKTNWTLGCISLTNTDIEDLYKSLVSTTKIEIVP